MFERLSWRVELVNVANVKISSSNVASCQLGIGIGYWQHIHIHHRSHFDFLKKVVV